MQTVKCQSESDKSHDAICICPIRYCNSNRLLGNTDSVMCCEMSVLKVGWNANDDEDDDENGNDDLVRDVSWMIWWNRGCRCGICCNDQVRIRSFARSGGLDGVFSNCNTKVMILGLYFVSDTKEKRPMAVI